MVDKNGIEFEDIGVIVVEIIENTITENNHINTIRHINYYRNLFHQILSGDRSLTATFIRDALYKLNYNKESFISNEYERLNRGSSQLHSIKENSFSFL